MPVEITLKGGAHEVKRVATAIALGEPVDLAPEGAVVTDPNGRSTAVYTVQNPRIGVSTTVQPGDGSEP